MNAPQADAYRRGLSDQRAHAGLVSLGSGGVFGGRARVLAVSEEVEAPQMKLPRRLIALGLASVVLGGGKQQPMPSAFHLAVAKPKHLSN